MYRFLQGRGRDDILGPESFKNSKAFRRYIEGSAGGVSLKDAVHEALENRIVLSMAPSACQAEEAEKGFQLLTLHVEAGRLCSVEYSHCDYRGAEFHQRPAKRLEVASGAADPSAKVFSANSGVKEND